MCQLVPFGVFIRSFDFLLSSQLPREPLANQLEFGDSQFQLQTPRVLANRKVRSDLLIRKRQFLTPVKCPTTSSSYHPQNFKACTTDDKDYRRSYSSGQDVHYTEFLPHPQLTRLLPLPRISMHSLREHTVTPAYSDFAAPAVDLSHSFIPGQPRRDPDKAATSTPTLGVKKSEKLRGEKA
jgi:hypothetical protein